MDRYGWMDWWRSENRRDQDMVLSGWEDAITREYEEAEVRWARIFGRRWEYFRGGSPEVIFSSIRLTVNDELGLYVANTGLIGNEEMATLRERVAASLAISI